MQWTGWCIELPHCLWTVADSCDHPRLGRHVIVQVECFFLGKLQSLNHESYPPRLLKVSIGILSKFLCWRLSQHPHQWRKFRMNSDPAQWSKGYYPRASCEMPWRYILPGAACQIICQIICPFNYTMICSYHFNFITLMIDVISMSFQRLRR